MYSGKSRGGAGGSGPPLLLDQTEAKRPEKNILEIAPPPLSTDAYKNIMNIDRCRGGWQRPLILPLFGFP